MTSLIDVHMPHMGAVENIVLTSWLKAPGDRVEENDPLCEVATDKVDTEVPAPTSGVLIDCMVAVEQEVPAGSVIARFAPPDAGESEIADALGSASTPTGAHAAESPPPAEPAPAAEVVTSGDGHGPASAVVAPESIAHPAPATLEIPPEASLVLRAALSSRPAPQRVPDQRQPGRGAPATPLVRKLAKEKGLDLAAICGTGPGGRVTRKDVEAAHAAVVAVPTGPVRQASPEPAAAEMPKLERSASASAGSDGVPSGYETVAHEAIALSPQRRAIARNLLESVSTAPQLTAQVDVDMSAVTRARAIANKERAARGQRKLSFLPFIARALCAVVAEHPDINATFTDTHLLRWQSVNLGIAVDAANGLFVPVVRGADRLTLSAMGDAISEVTQRVLDRKATTEDLSAGTITISNSGSVGGVIATPILTKPQVASLGLPAIVRTPVAVTTADGEEYVAIRPVARLGLTFDHRAFDGAQALRALLSVKDKLETWSLDAYR